jgi:predicted esterase
MKHYAPARPREGANPVILCHGLGEDPQNARIPMIYIVTETPVASLIAC